MKQKTIDYIKEICGASLYEKNNMARAQLMLKNFNFFREYNNESGFVGNIPFEALEDCLKSMVEKYDVSVGQILAITDISGKVTWHGGMYKNSHDKNVKTSWMFTVHSNDLYEYMVKLVLMSFVSVKTMNVKKRDTEAVLDGMRRLQ